MLFFFNFLILTHIRNIIREDCDKFEVYKNHMSRKKGFCEGQRVVIPIFDN